MEAVLPNFWEQNFASGSPAAYLPYQKSLPPGRKAVCISEAGYMADGFCCQHPKMTKPTKNETPISPSKIPSITGAFLPCASRSPHVGIGGRVRKDDAKNSPSPL